MMGRLGPTRTVLSLLATAVAVAGCGGQTDSQAPATSPPVTSFGSPPPAATGTTPLVVAGTAATTHRRAVDAGFARFSSALRADASVAGCYAVPSPQACSVAMARIGSAAAEFNSSLAGAASGAGAPGPDMALRQTVQTLMDDAGQVGRIIAISGAADTSQVARDTRAVDAAVAAIDQSP